MSDKINEEKWTVKKAISEYGADTNCVLPEKFDVAFIGMSHTDAPMYDVHILERLGYNPDVDGEADCSITVQLLDNEKPLVDQLDDETIVLEPREFLNNAIIGTVNGLSKAVYDYDLLVEAFLEANKDWDVEDADDWISYNTIRAIPYMGESSPVIMFNIDYML